jgi:hypothetical protein
MHFSENSTDQGSDCALIPQSPIATPSFSAIEIKCYIDCHPLSLQLRFQVFPDTGKVISRLWGERQRPWHVKVESTVQQEIPPSCVNGISGWIVETTRQIQERSPDRDGTINDGTIEEDAISWQLDYRSTSLYQPCANSETNSADTPDPS